MTLTIHKFRIAILMLSGLVFSFQSIAHSKVQDETSKVEKLVVEFYQKIFVQHHANVEKVAMEYVHENYIQHNPWVATGRAAFIEAFSQVVKNRSGSKQTEIKRVITSGNYVVLHVHSFDSAKPKAGYTGVDIFRVENDKIVEHWDVWQEIPEHMPHNNGML